MSKIRFHILLAALLVVTGCGEDDKVLPEQQQQFESFLSGSHQPRLVTEQEAMSSDEDLDFYSTFGRWSYRYIYHYYDSERQTRPEAEIGDEVDLVFWVYLFENRAITASTMPIYTNDRKWAEKLQEQGLDTKILEFRTPSRPCRRRLFRRRGRIVAAGLPRERYGRSIYDIQYGLRRCADQFHSGAESDRRFLYD